MLSVRNKVALPLADVDAPIRIVTFQKDGGDIEHFALVINEAKIGADCNVRVHSECMTGDLFGSLRCDCGPQLRNTMKRFSAQGGVICYLRQEGRGIGLSEKIAAYALQDKGIDTFAANIALGHPADGRDFTIANEMLNALNIKRIHLYTNNPDKVQALKNSGLEVLDVIPTPTFLSPENRSYLEAKAKIGHHLET